MVELCLGFFLNYLSYFIINHKPMVDYWICILLHSFTLTEEAINTLS